MDLNNRELLLPYTTKERTSDVLRVAATEHIVGYLSVSAAEMSAALSELCPETTFYFKITDSSFPEAIEESPVDSYFDSRLEIDRVGPVVVVDGRTLNLPHYQFELLDTLTKTPNVFIQRKEIFKQIWDNNAPDNVSVKAMRTVDVHIGRIRKVLSTLALAEPTNSMDGIIKSSRDFGYGFFTKDIVLAPRAIVDTHES